MAGCPNVAEARGRCRQHATHERKAHRSVNDAFYGSKAWKMSRAAQLFAHPLCQYQLEDRTTCDANADSVHHRIPIEEGGARRDPENLMSICRPAPQRHPRSAPISQVPLSPSFASIRRWRG
jgi:hypothetical protein